MIFNFFYVLRILRYIFVSYLFTDEIQGLDKIKETPKILASIFERVLNNQNLTF